jgi:hypothetical protein
MFHFKLLVVPCIVASLHQYMIVVPVKVPHERFTSREQEDVELSKAFNLQFVNLREKELARQERLQRLGPIGVFDADMALLSTTYGKISTDGQAYLDTLTPPSD